MITIQNLSFHYKSGRPIYSGVNMELQPGNIYGLLGENGVGKTTLLKLISGLLFPTGRPVPFAAGGRKDAADAKCCRSDGWSAGKYPYPGCGTVLSGRQGLRTRHCEEPETR